MADYLIRSALNGRRPRGFEDIDVRSRNNCFNLLLTEREKVRVISAPAGYEKSASLLTMPTQCLSARELFGLTANLLVFCEILIVGNYSNF